MMQQYRRVKHQIPPDALLLFRLGDFYEMFFDDAKTGSQLLNLALTHRNGVPMCGIPHHAAEAYIGRLLKHGRKVAVCDQLEEARPGKLVERDVTQILSPGTHFDTHILQAERNNFLAAICPGVSGESRPALRQAQDRGGRSYGVALVDLTTGDFRVTELSSLDQLQNELARVRPAEIIVPNEWFDEAKSQLSPLNLTPHDGWTFERETAFFTLRDHFKTQSLDGFGAADLTVGIGAAGAALHYLQQTLRRNTSHVHRLAVYSLTDFMVLDAVTQRNLELLEPRTLSGPKHTLIGCLDRTLTPMGARLLREWLTHPLKNRERIVERQGVVATFCDEPQALADFREQLHGVRDMERTLARLSVGTGNARDLVVLKESLAALPKLKKTLSPLVGAASRPRSAETSIAPAAPTFLSGLLQDLVGQITELPEIVDLISRGIVDAPLLPVKEGGLIKPGYNAPLDELRRASTDGKAWIAALQQREIARTGIASLKVRFNQVFGYYIEVTKANLDKVPSDYIRKQTIAGGERFYTPELKEMEDKILGADEKANALEYEIFQQIRSAAVEKSAQIQKSASAIAALDVLAGFAELARHQNYCRPTITDDDPAADSPNGRIEIVDGRHPVLEQTLIEERFVPNDALLDNAESQILIITGPNMAGKSTYIRQVALLVLMAQVGSFIPAARATISLVDRIFTRVGAADDLARGQSTFMVEMNETANILNNATTKSLIVLDEIGRGTSTFDGLSIAWAVAEHLHNVVGAKTLFATHYHELTELAATLPRVKNYNVAVREWHDQVIFLHKILPGGTDKSYGIQVGRLAGLPKEVVERAKEVLANLEEAEISADGKPKLAQRKRKAESGKPGSKDSSAKDEVKEPPQMYLFGGTKTKE